MTYQEDLTLEKKYLNLLNKYIYNADTDKFGMIIGIEITRVGFWLKAYYDQINDNELVFLDDFKRRIVKFTLIDSGLSLGKEEQEAYAKQIVDDIKSVFGEDFSNDMIIHVDDDERTRKNRENDEREKKNIRGKLLNISKITAEIFFDDYTAREVYKKFLDENISETEMLYLVCNHLCEEVKRLKNENLEYFIEKMNREHAGLLVDYDSRRTGIDVKSKDIISDDEKEVFLDMMDKLIDGFKEKYEEDENANKES